MAEPPARQRILDHGLDLMSEVGVSGVTLGVLAAETGMSKSGLFAHFRSKEALQIALLQRMAEAADAAVLAPALSAPAGLERLAALVGLWLGWTARAGLRGGCPVAAAMFELDDLDGDVRAEVVAMEARWRGLLAQLVREAVDRGELGANLDVDQFVWELCGVYLSHHASRRFLKDPAADERAHRAFRDLLGRSGAARPLSADRTPEAR
jgi:AcrR family transcriptional regulator